MKTFTAIGSNCIDVYYEIEKLPISGEKVLGKFKENIVGGMIGNAASVLAKYDQKVYILDYLNDVEDVEILRNALLNDGISTDAVEFDSKYINAKCLILLESTGERSIIVLNSPSPPYVVSEKQMDILLNSDYVYSSVTDIQKLVDYREILSRIKEHHVQLVFDVEPMSVKDMQQVEIIKFADIIFINEMAYERLKLMLGEDCIEKMNQSVPTIVLTLGASGSVSYHKGRRTVHKVVPTEVVDTTGAGDTYNASYLYAFSQGWKIELCGKFASMAASEKIRHLGARSGILTPEVLLKKVEEFDSSAF